VGGAMAQTPTQLVVHLRSEMPIKLSPLFGWVIPTQFSITEMVQQAEPLLTMDLRQQEPHTRLHQIDQAMMR